MAELQIIHVDLSESPHSIVSRESECQIIFWWLDYPVGQRIECGDPGRTIVLAPILQKSLEPDTLALAKRETEIERCAAPSGAVSASIVVCTRDRPEELARCLASLPHQTVRPLEIVVVDNASRDDRTRAVTLAASCKYVREDRPGLDYARNAGARAAAGDIIVYTDDDVHLHPRWLERMIAAFDSNRVMAVTGLVLPAELKTPAQRHFEKFWSFGRGFRRIDFDREFFDRDRTSGCPAWEVGAGASMGFRRAIFDKIGLFDERLDVGQAGCSGDSEYWHRVLTNGWMCRYEPSAVVFHYHRQSMDGLASQIFHYMRGHAAALLVQYERSGNRGNLYRLFALMPWYYAKRIVRGLLKGWRENDALLGQEIRGCFSGLLFYLRLAPHEKKHRTATL